MTFMERNHSARDCGNGLLSAKGVENDARNSKGDKTCSGRGISTFA